MLVALEFYLAISKQIILAGEADAPDTQALLLEVHRRFLPNKILLLADGEAGQAVLASHMEFIRGVEPIDGKATAYVCENSVCRLPTSEVSILNEILREE